MESGAIYPYDGFLCYVAQGGLSTYLDTKLSEMSLQIPMAQKVLTRYSQPARSGIPMLCFSQKQYLPINYHYGDPNVARVLLRYGADPKLVWEGFLHHGYHCFGPASRDIYRYSRAQVGMQVKDRRRWIDVLKLFLEHGANPITIVELRFGRRWGYGDKSVDLYRALEDLLDGRDEFREVWVNLLESLPPRPSGVLQFKSD